MHGDKRPSNICFGENKTARAMYGVSERETTAAFPRKVCCCFLKVHNIINNNNNNNNKWAV
jgi:hypothetical protein